MTDLQSLISQATTICEAATPGPWSVYEITGEDIEDCGDADRIISRGIDGPGEVGLNTGVEYQMYSSADATFIATSRTLLPQLAEALQESEDRRKESSRLLAESIRDTCGQAESLASHAVEQHAKHIEELTRERDEARAELVKTGAMLRIAHEVIAEDSMCSDCESKDVAVRCRACGKEW